MRPFDEIYAIAAERKGGDAALEALLSTPLPVEELARTTDDAWLAMMTKNIFRAGFSWDLIEKKWPAFETAFEGFVPARVAMYGDEELDRLLADRGIVRNGAKLSAAIRNAVFLREIAAEHGSMGALAASWPLRDHDGLPHLLGKRGAYMGSGTGQRTLRYMGRDGYVTSPDVVARLVAEGVIDKAPTSRKAMAAVQAAFNTWMDQSGRGLTQISQVLAFSV